jgi:hypothetical protein
VATLAGTLVVFGACPGANPGGTGGQGGSGGQAGQAGTGGSGGGGTGGGQAGTGGGAAGTGGGAGADGAAGSGGGNQPKDARPADKATTADTRTDAGTSTAGCGLITCKTTEVCCNASCGICTAPGGVCVQTVCPTGTGACSADTDCRLVNDYCTGCDCRALTRAQPDPICAGPGVQCIAEACLNKAPACVNGRCVARDVTSKLQWYFTCGDPVCGAWRNKPNIRRCDPGELRGTPCSTRDAQCDPMNTCNMLLQCTDRDPQLRPGGCPIARVR